jgi:hypothetical protein
MKTLSNHLQPAVLRNNVHEPIELIDSVNFDTKNLTEQVRHIYIKFLNLKPRVVTSLVEHGIQNVRKDRVLGQVKNPKTVFEPRKLEPRNRLGMTTVTVTLEHHQVAVIRQLMEIKKSIVLVEQFAVKVLGVNNTLFDKPIHYISIVPSL